MKKILSLLSKIPFNFDLSLGGTLLLLGIVSPNYPFAILGVIYILLGLKSWNETRKA